MDGPRGSEALRCTVRGCGRGLLREGARLACAEGHSFDRARGGWYHLAQPQDRRSREPGDGAPAVAGRELLRALGLGGGVLEAAARLAGDFQGVGVDVGCGGGALLERLHRPVARELFGVDLSAAAARVAARRGVATILVANADRGLPFRDGVVAAAFSQDARRPAAELARVLAPQGVLVAAVPAAEDLLELRELVLGRGILLPGGDAVVRELASVFVPLARERVEERVTLDLPGLTALADSTYRLSRRREREALLAGGPREVVSRHDLLLFVRARPQP